MEPLYKINATYTAQTAYMLGSFWTSVFSDPDKMRALMHLVWKNSAVGGVTSALYNLAGDHENAKLAENVIIPFKESEIIRSGTQYYDDPENAHTYSGNPGTVYGYYRMDYAGFLLKGIVPYSIQSVHGTLILGIDFFVLADRYIFFREDPLTLFPGRSYVVTCGERRDYRSYVSYMTKVNVPQYQDLIVTYFRHFQTPKYFRLALAAVGGLQILRSEQKLIDIQTTITATVYTFENETLRVDYDHVQLTIGKTYPAFHIIGDGVKVLHSNGEDRAWWKEIDWRGGMSLDPIIPGFRGLNLLDEATTAYPTVSDSGSVNGSKLHTRVKLGNDYSLEKRYWEMVASRETTCGYYLNGLLKLNAGADSGDATILDTFEKMDAAYETANVLNRKMSLPEEYPDFAALPGAEQVNALDTFFRAMLSTTAMVVLIDVNYVKWPREIYAFLNREMPTGCTPIIFSYGPNLQIETMQQGITISVIEPVVFIAAAVLPIVGEAVDLTTHMKDYAEIRIESPDEIYEH